MAVAPRTASTVVAVAIVSLLLRSMADPFLTRISILATALGTEYHTPESLILRSAVFFRHSFTPSCEGQLACPPWRATRHFFLHSPLDKQGTDLVGYPL